MVSVVNVAIVRSNGSNQLSFRLCISSQKAGKCSAFTRSTMGCFTVLQNTWPGQAQKTIFNNKRPRDLFLWWLAADPAAMQVHPPLPDVSELDMKKSVMLAHAEQAVGNFHGIYDDLNADRQHLLNALTVTFLLSRTCSRFCLWAMLPVYIASVVVLEFKKWWFEVLSHKTSCTRTS